MPTDLPESEHEARAVLRRVVRATRADLADMDRLLDRAERLASDRFRADALVPTVDEATLLGQARFSVLPVLRGSAREWP